MERSSPGDAPSSSQRQVPSSGQLEDHLPPHHRSARLDPRTRFSSHLSRSTFFRAGSHGPERLFSNLSSSSASSGAASPSDASPSGASPSVASPSAASFSSAVSPSAGSPSAASPSAASPSAASFSSSSWSEAPTGDARSRPTHRGGRVRRSGRFSGVWRGRGRDERLQHRRQGERGEEKVCVVCGVRGEDVKYKLPCCRSLFCSAACYQEHKKRSCDGGPILEQAGEKTEHREAAGMDRTPSECLNGEDEDMEDGAERGETDREAGEDRPGVCTLGAGTREKKRRRREEDCSDEEPEEGEEEEEGLAAKVKCQRRREEDDMEGNEMSRRFGEGEEHELSGEERALNRFEEGEEEQEEDLEENDELSVQQKEALRSNAKLREVFENNARLREAFAAVASSSDQSASLAMFLNDATFQGVCDQVMDIVQGDEN
ncbi:hypothetical protein TGME49_238080 [Toxoplasma gondii ME49]|uniref:HIT-type domain-containing protein n=2 Tax=Toxoplasma gondii TaxID=5811 RepID=A0A125YR01_TOXGV|nr:hypothetical protein TGME49_238080 [Toxoplasma gondii ME49]EPT30864.1 hypothetical protein TGME49_238080 [Toxoplasma gondii ME49]ESS31292.1 hypothetical protein TGVEG_238080 [Toxoplasma gondii VEG]CEL73486.1 TPA: hypothetical protein BN1205_035960 [Toxoplasma gondii VEG]|eukprot:XP_018637698.1 hypothetical protein TGME49_238080 [Toxoplasma gondii ME49]